jgi:hypothetical protein
MIKRRGFGICYHAREKAWGAPSSPFEAEENSTRENRPQFKALLAHEEKLEWHFFFGCQRSYCNLAIFRKSQWVCQRAQIRLLFP